MRTFILALVLFCAVPAQAQDLSCSDIERTLTQTWDGRDFSEGYTRGGEYIRANARGLVMGTWMCRDSILYVTVGRSLTRWRVRVLDRRTLVLVNVGTGEAHLLHRRR